MEEKIASVKKPVKRIKGRKKKIYVEHMTSIPINESLIEKISVSLAKQIARELLAKKYARAVDVLKLVGAGIFLAGAIVAPGLPIVLKPFIKKENEYELWKRFNIPYLKRTLHRLEKQKLVEIGDEQGMQVVKITQAGKRRILKFAIDELAVKKPNEWNGRWIIVSYDIPEDRKTLRKIFQEYLRVWGFYPLHKSVFLHAYPCEDHILFLREYLGVGEYVRILHVAKIENDTLFKKFFGL